MALRLRSGNRQLIREINQSLILGLVRDQGPISRTDIAHITHLSAATVSDITSLLIEQGLLYEQEAGQSTGGRRPILLALNTHAGLVIGGKLTETQIVVALTDLGGDIVDRRAVAIGINHSPDAICAQFVSVVHDLRTAHPQKRIVGLGLGMAGVIDRPRGICRFSPFFQWRDVPLGPMLEAELRLPVVLENDVNTLTLAEQWFGAGHGVNDFLVVTLGRGVGMGMVLNGQLYRNGGELGHLTMVLDGPRCECGKRGCLEALVSDPALLARIQSILERDVTMEEAVALARQGDATMQSIFAAAGRTLGLAIAHVVNIFNPPLLVVGGEGARALDLLHDSLYDALSTHCFNGFCAEMKLVVEPWEDDAWARGAASLMLEELFRPTLYRGADARMSLLLTPAAAA